MKRNFDKKTSLAKVIQLQGSSWKSCIRKKKPKDNGSKQNQNKTTFKIDIGGSSSNSLNSCKKSDSKAALNCSEPVFKEKTNQFGDLGKCKKNIAITNELAKCLYQMQNPNHQQYQPAFKLAKTVRNDSQPKFETPNKLIIPKINIKRSIAEIGKQNQFSLLNITVQNPARKTFKPIQSPVFTQRQAIDRRNQIINQKNHDGCVRLQNSKPSSNKYKRGTAPINLSYDRSKDIGMTLVRQQWKKTNQNFRNDFRVLDTAFDYNGNAIQLKKRIQLPNNIDLQFIKTNSKIKQKQELRRFGQNSEIRLSMKNTNQINRNISQMMKAININNQKDHQKIEGKDIMNVTKQMLLKSINNVRLKTQS